MMHWARETASLIEACTLGPVGWPNDFETLVENPNNLKTLQSDNLQQFP